MSQLICVFDTETTGFPHWKLPSDDPRQPHLIDVCALLYTTEGELVDSFEAMFARMAGTSPAMSRQSTASPTRSRSSTGSPKR